MSSLVNLVCIGRGVFKAATPQDLESLERFKLGNILSAKVTKTRNPGFHRKFFEMLNVGYDAFEPAAEYKGVTVRKNFEQFREDVTILAGYYDMVPRLDGSIRPQAKSISFAQMEQEDFEKLYSEVANVILEKVLTNYTREDLDNVVQQIMGFV